MKKLAFLLLAAAGLSCVAARPEASPFATDQFTLGRSAVLVVYSNTTTGGTSGLLIDPTNGALLTESPGTGGNGSTVYFPSGYVLPLTNSVGSTVYPGAGALWTVTSNGADFPTTALQRGTWTVGLSNTNPSASVMTAANTQLSVTDTGEITYSVSLTDTKTGYVAVNVRGMNYITLTVTVNGANGGTLFVDASNNLTAPNAYVPAQWTNLTPGGVVVGSDFNVSAANGDVQSPPIVVPHGYVWIRFRFESFNSMTQVTIFLYAHH